MTLVRYIFCISGFTGSMIGCLIGTAILMRYHAVRFVDILKVYSKIWIMGIALFSIVCIMLNFVLPMIMQLVANG